MKPNSLKKSQKLNNSNLFIGQTILVELVVVLLSVPYLLWQVIIPIIPLGKIADRIALISRNLLERKRVKNFVGINLSIVFLLFTILPGSIGLNNDKQLNTEPTLKQPAYQISTESTFRTPVLGYVSQNYSWHHHGIDIAGNNNETIFPISDGRVVEIAYTPFGYGKNIIIDHGNGILSRYAHLQNVSVGLNQVVNKDTILGLVGSTGWSTGPHLHLEIYQQNKTVNPLTYIPVNFEKPFARKSSLHTLIAIKNNDDILGASMSAQVEFKIDAKEFNDPNQIIYSGNEESEL